MEALRNHNKAYINHLTYVDLQNTRNREQTCKLRGRKILQALVTLISPSICISAQIFEEDWRHERLGVEK